MLLVLALGHAAAVPATQHTLHAGVSTASEAQHTNLTELWLSYSEAPILDHWLEYAEHYEQHFPQPDGTTARKMLEIGVQSGGSARAWKQYYGAALTYVGVDINGPCKRTENVSENIFVEIGSQLNGTFLREVCDKHGPFDMVIDDGGHSYNMMGFSVAALFSHPTCLTADAVYAIEDMHTMTMCAQDYCDRPSQIYDIVGRAFGGMHGHWFDEQNVSSLTPSPWAAQVRGMFLYDSMAFFQRGTPLRRLRRVLAGTDRLPYGSGDTDTRRESPSEVGQGTDVYSGRTYSLYPEEGSTLIPVS